MRDVEDVDPEMFRNLKWLLENDVTALDLFFIVLRAQRGGCVLTPSAD